MARVGGLVDVGKVAPAGPTGSTSPARTGGGPTPDNVSAEREPSTGATSMPPRTVR